MMRKFFRKFFFWDDPVAGAVFGVMLPLVFGFCLCNAICFHAEFSVVLLKTRPFGNLSWYAALFLLIILPLLIAAYSLFLTLAFFFRQDKKRFHWIFWSLLAAHVMAFGICAAWNCEHLGVFLCGLLTFTGFNALCIRRHNFLWYIVATVCWFACLPGAAVISAFIHSLLPFLFGIGASLSWIPAAWRVPLVYASALFFIGLVFGNFKLWASAGAGRLRDVWGAGCNILLVLFAVAYLTMTAAALYQQQQSKKALAALERNFQREISAEALKAFYYRDRKTDRQFHIALRNAIEEFAGNNPDFQEALSASATLDRLPGQYRDKFSSPEAERIGRFFDAPLPAAQRDYPPGRLYWIELPELNSMRQAAKCFAWQIRIACENKDHAKAMLAWRRSARITDYLEHETSMIAALVLISVEEIRLNGLEFLLSSRLLSDDELSELQQDLKRGAERMPIISRNGLYFEAVNGNDLAYGLADGAICSDPDSPCAEGIKHYRFLMPGLWYLAACNYCDLLKRYNVENLDAVVVPPSSAPASFLASGFTPALAAAGAKMHEMEMRYQAFVVLIEAEKIKRKTGKYPESAPLNITDHFSGEPLRYRVGSHTVRESFLVPHEKLEGELEGAGNYDLEYRKKTVQGVAVWSVGKNEDDDDGLADTRSEYGGRTDDRRALLTIP